MKRGRLYLDYTPNVSLDPLAFSKRALVPDEQTKPVLKERNDEERFEEERMENMQNLTAYSVLVNEDKTDERDNYEEDESGMKRKDIEEAIALARKRGEMESVSKLEVLMREFIEEQDARLQEEEYGVKDAVRSAVQDNPSLESKTVKTLIEDLETFKNESDDVKTPIATNVSSKLTSIFHKNFENLGGSKVVNDEVEMHEYAKLVKASYEFFEHRDFNKTREYLVSSKHAYIPGFNEWQVNDVYSSPDNLVFVKYGRDLNNPTVVIACRGTVTGEDWITNVNMVAGGTEQVKRFRELENTLKQLKSVYPDASIRVSGHSQGGGLSYALAQKYNLKGYHFDPAVFPTFRSSLNRSEESELEKIRGTDFGYLFVKSVGTWLARLNGKQERVREKQQVYKNAVDPVSMMMSLLDHDKNVKIHNVEEKAGDGTTIVSPHSLSNYYVDGYSGNVSNGVLVRRGGNVRKILEPLLKRAVATQVVRATGEVGGSIAVGLTVNDTFHALKKIEENRNLTSREKELKAWLTTGKNVADFTVSAGVGVSAETAAASMLASMGVSGAIAVGGPILMGAAAALVASQAIKWIGGVLEEHTEKLTPLLNPSVLDLREKSVKKRKISSR